MDFEQLVRQTQDAATAAETHRKEVEEARRIGRERAERATAPRRQAELERKQREEQRQAEAQRRAEEEWRSACQQTAKALRRHHVRRSARIGWLRRRGCWVLGISRSKHESGDGYNYESWVEVHAVVLTGSGRCFRIGPIKQRDEHDWLWRFHNDEGRRHLRHSWGATEIRTGTASDMQRLARLIVDNGASL